MFTQNLKLIFKINIDNFLCDLMPFPEGTPLEVAKLLLMFNDNCIMKRKVKIKKKKIRIPLPKQRPKVKESKKIYNRKKTKRQIEQ